MEFFVFWIAKKGIVPVSPRQSYGSVGLDLGKLNSENSVNVTLRDVFPVLLDAMSNGNAWLEDFAEEPIQVSSDLYDVLLAYRHFRGL